MTTNDTPDMWYTETLHEHVRVQYRIAKTHYTEKTDFQDMTVIENPTFGRMLTLDGITQTTQADETAYHEMLTHTPILAHGHVKSVLIIGGGDGGIAREVLKHDTIDVTMVELDASVTTFSQQYLPTLSDGAFDNPRLNLVFQDGCTWVRTMHNTYDVIIVDSTDPIGPGAVLFTEQFYADCKSALTHEGVLVTQQGVPMLQADEIVTTTRRQRPHYADVRFYKTAVSTYFGGYMTLGWATDNTDMWAVDIHTLHRRYKHAKLANLHYYTPEEHRASFSLPQFILDILKHA